MMFEGYTGCRCVECIGNHNDRADREAAAWYPRIPKACPYCRAPFDALGNCTGTCDPADLDEG